MSIRRDLLPLYARIVRTYFRWAGSLLPLAVVVFVPLGLVHAIPIHADIGSLDFAGGLKVFALALALLVLAATGLIGEIFYTGAVAIALTHPHDGQPPSMREVARMVSYGSLIAVDLIYGLTVAIGLVALVVPGVVAFIYLGLAAPVVEIEHQGIRASFIRSWRLVRGNFWPVLAVLGPIEIAGDALTHLAGALVHGLAGESLIAEWLTDTVSNIVFTPFYAVAAVLLTIDLIAARDGKGPKLHRSPLHSVTPPSP